MILLDTNVVSEPLKPTPNQAVIRWLDAQSPETLFLSSISVAELVAGVEGLPAGKRRTRLREAVVEGVLRLFSDRLLSFDTKAAGAFGAVHAKARRAGSPISFPDCAIAAIATAHGLAVATRNASDFRGTGISVVDPWAYVG